MCASYNQYARVIKMNREAIENRIPNGGECYDVIVVGGGVAGFGAALASGMMGAKTLLL